MEMVAHKIRVLSRKLCVYSLSTARRSPSEVAEGISASRLPVTMKSAPKEITTTNQTESLVFVAAPPPVARSTKPDATQASSMTGTVLSPIEYAVVIAA